uniref:Histone-lysine N-methyltransferase n=1 Tax=Ditylenchus dipsaci TaxID=166011 RepID=A0A915DU83_9BILA
MQMPVEEEVDEAEDRDESSVLDLTIDEDVKKDTEQLETYGEVEYTDRQKVCISLAVSPIQLFSTPISKKPAHQTRFTINNNVWVGRNPRDPKWHGCRLLPVKFPKRGRILVAMNRSMKRTPAKDVSEGLPAITPVLKSSASQQCTSTPRMTTALNSSIQWKKIEKPARMSEREDNTYSMSCLKCVHVNKKRIFQGQQELPIPNIKVVDQKWCEDPANPTIPHICLAEISSASSSVDQPTCSGAEARINGPSIPSSSGLCHPNDASSSNALPKIDFGPVYWSPSFIKQDCLIVLFKSRVHENTIYKFYIPTQYRGQSLIYARCSYCEAENIRKRASNKASLPIGKVAIQGDRWIGDPEYPPHPHFCHQRARQSPTEVFEEVDAARLAGQYSNGEGVGVKPELMDYEHNIGVPTFGTVNWRQSAQHSTAMAIVKCEKSKLVYEFLVMHRNYQQSDIIVRCYYCVAANQNRQRKGQDLLTVPYLAIHNNQWMQDPLNPSTPHICTPREPLVVQQSRTSRFRRARKLAKSSAVTRTAIGGAIVQNQAPIASAATIAGPNCCSRSGPPPLLRDHMNQPSGSASPTNLSTPEPKRRRISPAPNDPSTPSAVKKGDFGQVDWLQTKAETQRAIAQHSGQQLSFCITKTTYTVGEQGGASFAVGTCTAECLECKLVNQQRIKANLPLLPVPQLQIVNSRWLGQHPFYPHIPHFCALSLGTTSVEEEEAVEEEIEVVKEDISTAQPININTPESMARPASRKSALRIASAKTRRSSRGDKENSGSVAKDREPRNAAKHAMNALHTLSLSNKRSKKPRSILQDKQNVDDTPIRSYKLVLQNSVIEIEDEEMETFETNNLSIRNGNEDRLLREQVSIICISDEDEVQEIYNRKCKQTSIEQQSRAGSSSSIGSNLFVRDMSSTTSPTNSYYSAVGGECSAEGTSQQQQQNTSSAKELYVEDGEEDEELINRQNGIYEVDKVLAVRHNAGREIEYFLKWKSYDYTVSTWEKSEFVQECKELIIEFTKRERLREMIAASMKAAERPLYGQGHTASAFFSLQRWEDEMNDVLIANGQAPLLVENWVDTYGRPKNFKFITANILTPGALAIMEHPKIVPCLCLQGCISSKECCPDVICYTSNNRIRKNFNFEQNWLVECSDECACGIDCQTRVVQRGRRIPIIIFRTFDRGWSVRTAAKIPKNTFVMEYVGEVVTMEESKSIKSATYQFDMDACGADKCAFVVDAMHNGNEARFVNHSCDPNMIVRGVFCDRMDNRYLRLAFFAIKDIERGEEITINYFSKMDNTAYAKKTKNRTQKSCFCKAKKCRGYII